MKSSILLAFLVSLSGIAVQGAVVNLNMASLPSAQGWTYQPFGATHGDDIEANVWSTNGSTLTMNTIGAGLVSPSSNAYVLTGLVNTIYDITVTWTSRVIQHEHTSHYGWSIVVGTGVQGVGVGFETDSIQLGSGTPINFNTTGFHVYRLEFTPGETSFDLFVDNVFFASGAPTLSGTNRIFMGDGSGASNAHAQLTSFSFNQVPEVSAVAMLLLGAGALFARRSMR